MLLAELDAGRTAKGTPPLSLRRTVTVLPSHGSRLGASTESEIADVLAPSGSARLSRDVDNELPSFLAEHGLKTGVAPNTQGARADSSFEVRAPGGLG